MREYVFAAIALVDPHSGEVELLSAGHGPMLHLSSARGTIAEFNGDALPLGLIKDEEYGRPASIKLEPSSGLLCAAGHSTLFAIVYHASPHPVAGEIPYFVSYAVFLAVPAQRGQPGGRFVDPPRESPTLPSE